MDWDLNGGLDLWNELIRIRPTPVVFGNQAVVLARLGRQEEALAANMKAMEISPFGPGNIICINATDRLIVLGRYDEADRLIPQIPNEESRERRRLYMALATSNWSLADSIVSDGLLNEKSPLECEAVKASLDVSRGSLESAMNRGARARTTKFAWCRSRHSSSRN